MRKTVFVLIVLLVAAATVAVLALMSNVFTRQREAEQVVFKVVDLDETVADPAQWGKNFPRQYDGYVRTVDTQRTKYGGSEAEPHSKIDADTRLKRMWAGYAFSVEFREERGHAYMLVDQRETERVKQFKQPGACLHCHASVTTAYRQVGIEQGAGGSLADAFDSAAGRNQLMQGFAAVCAMPYADATAKVQHPVACIDCHDPQTLALRVTRPGFLEGIANLAKSADPLPHLASIERWRAGSRDKPYDPNALATRQEMRSFVCGQCHVEYYFHGDQKRLTYPWHNGLKVEHIEAYYDQAAFKDGKAFNDWTHKTTGAGVLKAQHPEFELWNQGTHARAGVACADCHMPYMREGAIKLSDHHVRSPLLNVARSCQVCHRNSEQETLDRVKTIQDRTTALMDRALDALMALIDRIDAAQKAGSDPARIDAARALQRRAQFRIDFINAENSTGFHAAQESARILGEAIDFARQGEIVLLGGTTSAAPASPSPPTPAAP